MEQAGQKMESQAEQFKKVQEQQAQLKQYVDSQVNAKLATYNLDVQRLLIGAQAIEALCNAVKDSTERQTGELVELGTHMVETLTSVTEQLHKAFVTSETIKTEGESIEKAAS